MPDVRFVPKIIEFLGYAPCGAPATTFPARLKAARIEAGLTRRQLAASVGVHPSTVAKWERGEARPILNLRRRVQTLLGIPPSETP
jgi:transcriptional regulator with XRE-family HTH domain